MAMATFFRAANPTLAERITVRNTTKNAGQLIDDSYYIVVVTAMAAMAVVHKPHNQTHITMILARILLSSIMTKCQPCYAVCYVHFLVPFVESCVCVAVSTFDGVG